MKVKQFFLLIAIFLFCFLSLNSKEMTLAYVDFPPYEFQENGEAQGILVDIVKEIFEDADISLELRFLPFKRAYESVKNSEIDGLFNFYKTDERLKHFRYSESIINNPLVFFVRRDSDWQFEKLSDLKNAHIGVIRGYTYGDKFDNSGIFKKDETNSHVANFKKLALGRIDLYPCDKLVGIHIAMKNSLMSELKILPNTLKEMKGYIGFSKNTDKDSINQINEAIMKMKKNNEIENIIDEYLKDNMNY